MTFMEELERIIRAKTGGGGVRVALAMSADFTPRQPAPTQVDARRSKAKKKKNR